MLILGGQWQRKGGEPSGSDISHGGPSIQCLRMVCGNACMFYLQSAHALLSCAHSASLAIENVSRTRYKNRPWAERGKVTWESKGKAREAYHVLFTHVLWPQFTLHTWEFCEFYIEVAKKTQKIWVVHVWHDCISIQNFFRRNQPSQCLF